MRLQQSIHGTSKFQLRNEKHIGMIFIVIWPNMDMLWMTIKPTQRAAAIRIRTSGWSHMPRNRGN